MTRTLLAIVLTALLAAPLALAQGPPPGYTDPLAYAQDYAAEQADQAGADPVGYATSKDAVSEADHALWLACWTAYDQAGHALDAACSQFFTAPQQIDAAAQGATAEITEVLNETGAAALLAEGLDVVNDTLADPTSALDQVQRLGRAVVDFVHGLLDFVLDALGLGGLAVAAGLLGAAQGLLDLLMLPVQGAQLAFGGLGAALTAAAHAAAASVTAVASAVLGALGLLADAGQAVGHGLLAGLLALGDGIAAAGQGLTEGLQATAQGAVDTVQAAAQAVQDGVHSLGEEVSSWFGQDKAQARPADDLLDDAPKTGTPADGLLGRLRDLL